MHVCIFHPDRCVCVKDIQRASSALPAPFFFRCSFKLPPVGPIFLCQKRGVYTEYSVLHTARSTPRTPILFRHSVVWSLCGAATEDSVTNSNYICVFFMNPSSAGLLKMLPRYLRLSATSSWDQIGMLLRQSRTTQPLVSPVMCVTACVGEYHVLFNYKRTPSTVVDVLEIGQLQVQFEARVCVYVMCGCPVLPPKHLVPVPAVRPCSSRHFRTPFAFMEVACIHL